MKTVSSVLLISTLLSSAAFAEAKPAPTVAIQDIEDRSAGNDGYGECSFYHLWSGPGGAVREVLTDELLKKGNLTVLERKDLGTIYENEFLNENLDESTKVKKKKFIGAKYAISGVISEFEWCVSGQNQNLDLGGLIGFGELKVGHRSSKAHVAMDLRLIDVETGKVLKTFRTEGKADDGGLAFEIGAAGVHYSRDGFSQTPLGKANREALAKAAAEIVAAVQRLN